MKLSLDKVLNILLIVMLGFYISRYLRTRPEFKKEELAPNFEALLINGQQTSLEDFRGQYVLLDFWGSWCGPCRRQNPKLVRLYEKYEGKKFTDATGFEIISIGIEQSDQAWKAAIEKDGLKWPYHIKDASTGGVSFSGPVSALYQVKSIPTSYLLDPEGKIIAVNGSFSRLNKILENKLL